MLAVVDENDWVIGLRGMTLFVEVGWRVALLLLLLRYSCILC